MTEIPVLWGADLSRGPSPHLSWSELACHDPNRTPYPVKWRRSRGLVIGYEFELIRELVGGPIRINSAFRTLSWNTKSKSKPTSQHVKGRALDLGVPAGLTMPEFLDLVLQVARRPGGNIRGIGLYPRFLHIDTRKKINPDTGREARPTRIARWRGTRVKAELLARVA